MSYILEALKKADQKRKIGAVPDLHTEHNLIRNDPSQRVLWPYLLALLLLFNAGFIFWWLGPRGDDAVQQEITVAASVLEGVGQVAAEKVPDLSVAPTAELSVGKVVVDGVAALVKENNRPAGQAPNPGDNASLQGVVQVGAAPINPATEELIVPPTDMVIPEYIPEEGRDEVDIPFTDIAETDEFEDSEKSDNAAAQAPEVGHFDISQIPFAYQLPAAIKQKLPAITISFHSYTFRPATRMVRVNGRIMREGHNLTKEIKLEKIVPTGVVLLFGQRRFRVDV